MRPLIAEDVIISLQKSFADGLVSGIKCVELRRRVPYLKRGIKVWFYTKVPIGSIVAYGVLNDVAIASPDTLWNTYSHCSGLKHEEFNRYFNGVREGAALLFTRVFPLHDPVSLHKLKALEPNFHPPQFFRRIQSPVLQEWLNSADVGPEVRPCEHHGPSD